MTIPVTLTAHAAGHTTAWPKHPTLTVLAWLFKSRGAEMTTYSVKVTDGRHGSVIDIIPADEVQRGAFQVAQMLAWVAERAGEPDVTFTFDMASGAVTWRVGDIRSIDVTVGC